MNKRQYPWWAAAALLIISASAPIVHELYGGLYLDIGGASGICYLIVMPVLAAAVITLSGAVRGKFDLISVIAFWAFGVIAGLITSAITVGMFQNASAFFFILAVLSIPAAAAAALSGIAWLFVGSRPQAA